MNNSPYCIYFHRPLRSLDSRGLLDSRYELLSILGEGSFSEAFKALDVQENKYVVIKKLKPEEHESWQSFSVEALIMASLDHPAIPKVENLNLLPALDYNSLLLLPRSLNGFKLPGSADMLYMAMSYVEGSTLHELIETRTRFSERKIRSIGSSACDALQYIHEREMAHLDIKPKNMLLDNDGNVYLFDFGAARQMGRVSASPSWTPRYAPPEQKDDPRNFEPHPTADIYSLAAALYESLTHEPVPKSLKRGFLTSRRKDVSHQLEDILMIALQKNKMNRFQSMSEFESYLSAPYTLPKKKADVFALSFAPKTQGVNAHAQGLNIQGVNAHGIIDRIMNHLAWRNAKRHYAIKSRTSSSA